METFLEMYRNHEVFGTTSLRIIIKQTSAKKPTKLYIVSWIYPNLSVNDSGPGSVVGIATAYGPGIESRWCEIFRTSPDRPWGPPSLLYIGYRVFLGGKVLPGRDADPSPPSSAEV